MIQVPAGSFRMGSPPGEGGHNSYQAVRRVTFSRPYLIGATEITQAQWRAVLGGDPSHFEGCDDCPVESVTWLEAIRFCNALSLREGLPPAYRIEDERVTWERGAAGYRLPTEAEWERAARAGTTTPYWFGERIGPQRANCSCPTPAGDPPATPIGLRTTPVATFQANALGLHDVHGNVWEWCWDRFAALAPADTLDPAGPDVDPGMGRISRGGSWSSAPLACRAAFRNASSPDYRCGCLGLRVARGIGSGDG